MVHNGWKGDGFSHRCQSRREMRQEYGTDPENVMAAFGPMYMPPLL